MIRVTRLLGITFIIQSCYTVLESSPVLDVTIDVGYTPPSTFDHSTSNYRAGSPLTLFCNSNIVARAFYHWTSNCSMNCFVKDKLNKIVSTSYLRSTDSGVHTCTVLGSNEERGSASVTVNVVGAGIYDSINHAALPNNSLILAGQTLDFSCVSGSSLSNIGDVFDNDGMDVSISRDDPFFTFQRTIGAIHIKSLRQLQSDDQGIYTCHIPDETGSIVNVNVGLYRNDSVLNLTVTRMKFTVIAVGMYTLTCTSTGSPPTTVTWMRNQVTLTTSESEGMYTSYQIVTHKRSSTYDNVLNIRGDDATGNYTCKISNSLYETFAEKTIAALKVTGHESTFVIGFEATLRCSTVLNIKSISWYETGMDTFIVSNTSSTVELDLTPDSIDLNGTQFTCTAETVSGKMYSDTVAIKVRDFINRVSISGPSSPWLAGDLYTLICVVVADSLPDVKWTDASGNYLMEKEEELILSGPVVSRNQTFLNLTFKYLRTSQAGRYSCVSDPLTSGSVKSYDWNVNIQLPKPTVNIVSQPNNSQYYIGHQFKLTCNSQIHPAVDTSVNVTNTWYGGSGRITSDSILFPLFGENIEFNSSLRFSPLNVSHSGNYSCDSTVYPTSQHVHLVKSDTASTSFVISPSLKTKIVVSYIPPDLFPDYAPPNYRAASSVTLSCTTEGASGNVSYIWSSTCSSCFVTGYRGSTLTRDFLRTRDAGAHTCTATDSNQSRGSDTTHMNIVGAGIYVEKAQCYAGKQLAQPNNTFIGIYSESPSSGYDYSGFRLWCCSNSTERHVGSFTDPNGTTLVHHFKDRRMYQYSSSSTYGGCIQLEGYRYDGVYTCIIPDASGKNHTITFALTDQCNQRVPSIYHFHHFVDSHSVLTLTCETRTLPPTEITWQKDGVNLTIDGSVVQMTQRVTDRHSSHYVSTLSISDDLANHTATYTVIVGNSLGYVQKDITLQGITISPSDGDINGGAYIGEVGRTITFNCSSDLFPSRIEWYRDGLLLSQMNGSSGYATIDIISTDDHKVEYSCKAVSYLESQEKNFTFNVEVPDNWASIEIANLTHEEPLQDNQYTLICSVKTIEGMNLPLEVHWYLSDDPQNLIQTGGRLRVDSPKTTGTVTTLKLTFSRLLHDDGGDYTCRAKVDVSWMVSQPPVKKEVFNVVVTTQAYLQLRIGPLTHCSTWKLSKAYDLEGVIKRNIEYVVKKRCHCAFSSSAIYSGEFSCRTSRNAVMYRAIINGSSEILRADDVIAYIEDWKRSDGTLLYNKFRLQLSQSCPLIFKSFSEAECRADGDEGPACKGQTDGLLFDSRTCYKFKSCDEGEMLDNL